MVFFFTSVGFQANLKVLKSGGKSLIVFLGLVIVLIILQNLTAVGLAKLLNLNPLIGMCTGSIPMVGGHGTAGAFGPVLEDLNIKGATTICTAAATFGLIFGSLIGGPLGKRLIEKHSLLNTAANEDDSLLVVNKPKGMVVHPAPGNPDGTLVNALLWHCKGSLSGIGGEIRPGIVHRIDKDTSGLVLAAKNAYAAPLLAGRVTKLYYAIAQGALPLGKGAIDAPIGRRGDSIIGRCVTPEGKPSRTEYTLSLIHI